MARLPLTQELIETDPAQLVDVLSRGLPADPKSCGIIENYLTDLKLVSSVEAPLLEAMLPRIWSGWQNTLLVDTCRDMTSELISTFFQKPALIGETLGDAVQEEVQQFALNSFLHAIGVDAAAARDMRWVPLWSGLCACWPGLVRALWDELVQFAVPNHARAILAYLARLGYRDSENPLLLRAQEIVDPWAQSSFESRVCWGREAMSELGSRLEWDAVEGYLRAIVRCFDGREVDEYLSLVAVDIQERRKAGFIRRRAILLDNLGRPGLDKFWNDDFSAA